jgi:hypothetical protein
MGINTNKEFDQIFKDALHDHEVMPPESIWAGIEAAGLTSTAAKSSNWRWWAAASVLALLLSTSAYLYFDENDAAQSTNNKQNISQQDIIIEETPMLEENQINSEIQNNIEDIAEINTINPSSNITDNNIQETANTEINAEDIKQVEQMIFEEEKTSEEDALVLEQSTETNISRENDLEQVNSFDNKAIEEELSYQNIDKPMDDAKASKAGRDFFDEDAMDDMTSGHLYDKYWVLGLEFSPEWVTLPDNSNNINSYGADFSAKYYFSKWFAETGLGLAFSKDNGDYEVDYQIGRFKGSYEDVYNVTFDTSGGAPVPTYYTKTVNIYDTVDVVSVEQVENKYAYINIPLNIGFATPLGDKFTFYAKTGLIASFKIYENLPVPQVSIGGDDIIINPDNLRYKIHRTSWHLQAQLNVGIDYHITDKFAFGIEPNVRYYVKSLVENNPSGNPYGLGVKIGFKYTIK